MSTDPYRQALAEAVSEVRDAVYLHDTRGYTADEALAAIAAALPSEDALAALAVGEQPTEEPLDEPTCPDCGTVLTIEWGDYGSEHGAECPKCDVGDVPAGVPDVAATERTPDAVRQSGDWADCTGTYHAEASITPGDAWWPSMISVEWPEPGTITSDDARSFAAMLSRLADACDVTKDAS